MKRFEELKKQLQELKAEIREQYHVSDISLFGSYVKAEAKPESDLDILVSFSEPVSLFKFLELEDFLSEKLGIKVDLVSRKALKPGIDQRILQEAVSI